MTGIGCDNNKKSRICGHKPAIRMVAPFEQKQPFAPETKGAALKKLTIADQLL